MKMENEEINMNPQKLIPILILIACIGLLPTTQAVLPAPDGGYPGGNTAEGQQALLSLSGGGFNTAVGWFSLKTLSNGSFNTATGAGTLPVNTADDNTATGAGALFHNTLGTDNTGIGTFALFDNTEGYSNTATGVEALGSNLGGYENTADGVNALVGNTYGVRNTATGVEALFRNVLGNFNTANGFQALHSSAEGSYNTAIGGGALFNTTGGANIGVGFNAGGNLTTGNLNIDIGNTGLAAESNTIRIGTQGIQTATYVGGIFGATLTDGVPVLVGTDGHLGTAVSSERFKNDIKSMGKASEAILALKPVTFHYKTDVKGIPQFGLVAEEVAKVNQDLVVRDKNGEIYTVRYEAINAMLLNEFLKEHRKVEEQQGTIGQLKSNAANQEAMIGDLKKDMGVLTAQLKEQAAHIQNVSVQIELNKSSTRTALSNQ
jgi:hypothetical protein